MSGQHTPGPWVVNNYPRNPRHPWIVAKCNFEQRPDGGEYYFSVSGIISQEDARLIAAAPELLSALRELMDAYAACNGEDHPAYLTAEEVVITATEGRS